MTTTVILLSDIHANSSVGLCPPVVNLYNGGTYRASRPQKWVYSRFLEFRDRAGETIQRDGGRVVLFLDGELADDNKHSKYELVEQHPDAQMTLAIEAIRPVLELIDKERGDLIYVLRGTAAHSGPGAWMDNRIGADIGAVCSVDEPKPDGTRRQVHSFQRVMVSADGVRIKGVHHPPIGPGRVPWTANLYAPRLASMAYYGAIDAGEPPPDIYFSGHYHIPGDSYDMRPTRALPLPSWQLPTEYVHRLGIEQPAPIGGVLLTCDRGRVEVTKHWYEWPTQRYEAI